MGNSEFLSSEVGQRYVTTQTTYLHRSLATGQELKREAIDPVELSEDLKFGVRQYVMLPGVQVDITSTTPFQATLKLHGKTLPDVNVDDLITADQVYLRPVESN